MSSVSPFSDTQRRPLPQSTLRRRVTVLLAAVWLTSKALYAGSAYDYLVSVMDQYHSAFDVYTDDGSAGNHFHVAARLDQDPASKTADTTGPLAELDENCPDHPHQGKTCIKSTFSHPREDIPLNWGGWYLLNGVLSATATDGKTPEVEPNWGSVRHAGINLSGATELSFWARGEHGGESVKFFAFGVGWNDAGTGPRLNTVTQKPFGYPDSSPQTAVRVTLSKDWKRYSIPLRKRNLSYVLGGFGWTTEIAAHTSVESVTFYLDDIRYNKSRLNEPRFLLSYAPAQEGQPNIPALKNVAFTYDNAVALIAFLASGDKRRAGLIADALVYAHKHDRFFKDGRLRNGYAAGDIALPSGWTPNGVIGAVSMPGWWSIPDKQQFEDLYQISTDTGNVAWTMLSLLAYYEVSKDKKYLQATLELGEWVEKNCVDHNGPGGYTGQFLAWEPTPKKMGFKATEHNIDLYAAFQHLWLITHDEKWKHRADHAGDFIAAMWDDVEGKFWAGTEDDGVKINRELVPVDVQSWSLLALRSEGEKYIRGLNYAEANLSKDGGFDFNQDRDGIWYEGTAQMAVAYQSTGQTEKSQACMRTLESGQLPSGALPAASKDSLTTGLDVPSLPGQPPQPWLYYKRAHVGATAWKILAETGTNPFWFNIKP